MRRLARELGFEVMSLYNHVRKKDEVLDGALDTVIEGIERPANDLGWRDAVHHLARSTRRVLLAHPWAARIWSQRDAGPARLRYVETLLGCLRDRGFSPELTYRGFHSIHVYVLGYTNDQLDFEFDAETMGDEARAFVESLSPDEFPHLIEHVEQHLDGPDYEDEFRFGLDIILDGLERAREDEAVS